MNLEELSEEHAELLKKADRFFFGLCPYPELSITFRSHNDKHIVHCKLIAARRTFIGSGKTLTEAYCSMLTSMTTAL